MKKPQNKVVLGMIAVVILITGALFSIHYFKPEASVVENQKVKANSDITTVTTEGNWESGTLDNINSTASPGSISISGESKLDLSGKSTSTVQGSGSPNNAIDGDWSTNYETWPTVPGDPWWQVDLGSVVSVRKIKYEYAGYYIGGGVTGFITILGSADGISFESITGLGFDALTVQTYSLPTPKDYRYIRASIGVSCEDADPNDCKRQLYEVEIYPVGATATHITAPTQIDGSEGSTKNFITWETFTPVYTKPANTNVQFRFRTSANASTWTAWSGYQTPASAAPLDISAIVDSASGANKYLQVETTLENTDGASTPTVDSYSVQYHTDVKPNKPTAASANVQ